MNNIYTIGVKNSFKLGDNFNPFFPLEKINLYTNRY